MNVFIVSSLCNIFDVVMVIVVSLCICSDHGIYTSHFDILLPFILV